MCFNREERKVRDTARTAISDGVTRHAKFWQRKQQDVQPIFFLDGATYVYLKVNGLYFVGSTKSNVDGSLMMRLFRLTEKSIRKNFLLLYELLDEVLDFGYVQGTSSETSKEFVFNEPNGGI